MIDKSFLPVWDSTPGYNPMNDLSNQALLMLLDKNDKKSIEERFLFFENEDLKIYYFKVNEFEVSISYMEMFFAIIKELNVQCKKIIYINPTETVSGNYENLHKEALFVLPDRWQGIGTFLYTKSMFDGLFKHFNEKKWETILEQNYKPFNIVFLVRRGHNRRFEFFKYLHSKNNSNLFLTYKNADLSAKSEEDETKHLNFEYKDGIDFPYQSHAVIQPIDYHAAFNGFQFMFQNVCLLTMGKFNLVVESNPYEGALTEKSMYPFFSKTIPILTNGKTHIQMLENMGFYTFVDELGIRTILNENIVYYEKQDNTKYFEKYNSILDKIAIGEFDYLYDTHKDKIDKNHQLCIDIQKGIFNTYSYQKTLI